MKMQSKKPGPIRAALLTWLGFSPHPTHDLIGSSSAAGMTVTPEKVLGLSAAWACTRLIAETIATLPLSVYERTPGGKRLAPQHPLQFIIHDQPNPDTTAAVHWEALVAAMLLRGAARCEKLLLGNRLVGLQFLHPDRLDRIADPSGRQRWEYQQDDGTRRVIADDRVWTVPGFSVDGKSGISVIRAGAQVFGAALAAERAASATFANGLHQTTAWTYPNGVLSATQRDEARGTIKKLSGAVNAGNPVILEAGMTVQTIGINPNDAQLLESRAFSVEEVCRWFRVPPFMVGHSEKSTSWGSGIEQQMIGFLTFTLNPWLKRLEQAIEKDLLAPGERRRFYVKFTVEGLLRADSAARAAFYSQMVNNGVFTRDDVREKEDLPPKGGNAAVLTVQSAMVPLDSLGQTAEPAPPPPPPPAASHETTVVVNVPDRKPQAMKITRDSGGNATMTPVESD